VKILDEKLNKILETEYSEEFDEIRKRMMITSFYKYGPLHINYGTQKYIDSIKSLEKRLEKYKETGNLELLADIANFAMIEFMSPQHPDAHYTPTDCAQEIGVSGMGINEIKNFL
jgi:hypothetical protein